MPSSAASRHPAEAGQYEQQPELRHAHLAVKYLQTLQGQPDERPRHQLKRRHGTRLGIPSRKIVHELKYCTCEHLVMTTHGRGPPPIAPDVGAAVAVRIIAALRVSYSR
jgi:hypothetical protein